MRSEFPMSAWGHSRRFCHVRAEIAVGTAVTSRPPHRSVHAEFPHTAPTLGVTSKLRLQLSVCAPAPVAWLPGSVPGPCFAVRIPLGPRPSLHQLRGGSLRFVRRLPSYYGRV